MNVPKWLALFLLLLSTGSISVPAAASSVGDSQGVIFSAEQIKNQKFINVPGPYWTPSKEQVDKLEKKLPAYLKNQSNTNSKALEIDLQKYKRQYFGYSLSGNKVIYVNAFCDYFDYWKTTFVFVFDGGQCFFQATYDPESDKFVSFGVNGEA